MYRKGKAKLPYHLLFLGPGVLVFFVVVILPFIISVLYSFTDWNGVSKDISFIGLQNFIDIFTGKTHFLDAFWFTFTVSVVNVVLVMVLGVLAAVVLTSALPLRNLFRLSFYVPNVIGGMVLGFIWRFIYLNGLPAIGKALGIDFLTVPLLNSGKTAFWAVVIMFVWQNLGYVMVVMTAGFSSIPYDTLEAARIDGAGGVQTFFRVKLPQVMPYITICLFWTIAMAFKMFELPFALNKGGPYGSTTTLALNIYNDAFANNRYGLATAESLIFFLIIAAITMLQMFFTNRKERQYG